MLRSILELATPGQPIPGRQRDLLRDFHLCLINNRADVAAAHVGRRYHTPLAVFPADLIGAFAHMETRKLAQRNGDRPGARPALRQGDRQIFQRKDFAALRIGKPDNDLEATIPLEHESGRAATDRDTDKLRSAGRISELN